VSENVSKGGKKAPRKLGKMRGGGRSSRGYYLKKKRPPSERNRQIGGGKAKPDAWESTLGESREITKGKRGSVVQLQERESDGLGVEKRPKKGTEKT